MTPATRLLESVRAWYASAPIIIREAVDALDDVRALYPAAFAIGERVSVVYPPELRATKAGAIDCQDFTGIVNGVEFHEHGVDYRVTRDGDPDYTIVEAAHVHPAELNADTFQKILNHAKCGGWTATFDMDWMTDEQRAKIHAAYRGSLAHDAPVTSTNTCTIPGRVEITTHTDENGVRTAFASMSDKARRESIARAVITAKPGPEGGSCIIDYRAAALILFNLLDDIDTLDDACRDDDAAFRRLALVKAKRREDVGASFDGYTVAFIGEKAYADGQAKTSIPDVPGDPNNEGASITPGAVVTLRSGGPKMTVDAVEGETVCVVWFADGKLEAEEFCAAALVRA